MEINDDERLEVAARLRNNLVAMRIRKDWYYEDSDVVECGNAAYRNIAESIEEFGNMIDGNYIRIVERLADLIEPEPEHTCKIRQSYFDSDNELNEIMEGIAFSPEDTVACICEACGHDWRYDRGIRPNYCPNCGAKVIELRDSPNGSMLRKAPKLLRNYSETRCEMIPRLKWHERLLCWLLFKIEAKHGLVACFDEIDLDAMKWFVKDDHLRYGAVYNMMRDYIYIRMAREYEKEQRNA